MALCCGRALRVAKEMAERRLANCVGEPRGKWHRSGVRPRAREVSSCGYPLDRKKKKKKKKKRMEIPSQPDRGQMLRTSGQAFPSTDA